MAALFKTLFALLVVANLILAAVWFDVDRGLFERWLAEPPPTQVERGPWPLPPVSSATDLAAAAGASSESVDEAAVSLGDEAVACVVYGPFDDEAAAVAATARITAAGGWAEATRSPSPPSSYMVYIEPAANERGAEAVRDELSARAIDAFVIPSGERRNAVSVGVFSARDSAEAQRRRIAALGYSVAIHAPERMTHRVVARDAPPNLLPNTASAPCD